MSYCFKILTVWFQSADSPTGTWQFKMLSEKTIERIDDNQLARELAKLDGTFEQQFADEGMGDILEVPEY